MENRLYVFLLSLTFAGCASLSDRGKDEAKEPPAIVDDMELDKALIAAIKFGKPTVTQVSDLIRKRSQEAWAGNYLQTVMSKYSDSWPSIALYNAMEMFRTLSHSHSPILFSEFIASKRQVNRHLAWVLAGSVPSEEMAHAVEKVLTESIIENTLDQIVMPPMAEAIVQNQLKGCYTVLRYALFNFNHESYAQAMMKLQPNEASNDFLDYLARAPLEELRQLNLPSVNVVACMAILDHLNSRPVIVAHRHFESLFLYAISRNQALSRQALKILSENYFSKYGNDVAYKLSRMSNWIQIAFVENIGREPSPATSRFLRVLKKTTSQKEVIEALNRWIR